jgi:hypothetical protein
MKKQYFISMALLMAAMFLAACSSSSSETPYPSPESNAYPYPYPMPMTELILPTKDASYPAPPPTPTFGVPYEVPEVTADKGAVIGKLVDINTGEPLAYQKVYLGFKIPLTPGPGVNYGLQELSSPQTITDEQGRFAIGDIEPGSYIVIAFHPAAISVVMQPNSDLELDVVVSAGELQDLGTLEVQPPYK